MRPYFNPLAAEDYEQRLSHVDNVDHDYETFSQFWIGDYEGDGNPFE